MVKISINKVDLDHVLSALERVKRIAETDALVIAEESAREFSSQIKKNVASQKFGDFGHPHKDWKKKVKDTNNRFWYWLGGVFRAVSPKKIRRSNRESVWRVGFYGGVGGSAPTTSTASTVKKVLSDEERKAIIKEAVAKRKEAAAKAMSEKASNRGVTIHGPNSELVQRLNKERGYTK
jgi:hypothetical protein